MAFRHSRKEMRVDVNLPVIVTKICYADKKVFNLKKIIPIEVVNLSASGALICSHLNLPEKLKFFMDLPVELEKVPCIAEIIRKEIRNTGYFYGCKLFFPYENTDLKVRRFLMLKQMELARRSGICR